MIDTRDLYNKFSKETMGMAILPISRLSIEKPFEIEGVTFSNADDIASLDVILNQVDDRSFLPCQTISDNLVSIELSGDSLRRCSSTLTGITKDILLDSTLAILPIHTGLANFETMNHKQDIELLSRLSYIAFKALDIIRYCFCRLNLPDTLPGIPGYWKGSVGFMGGAILKNNGCARLIGSKGQMQENHMGLGLELSTQQISSFEHGKTYYRLYKDYGDNDDISKAVRRGVHMLSRAMYINNESMKYLSVMALFEYLGTGNKYKKFESVRKKLQPHLSKNKVEYEAIGIRFREFSSKKDGDNNIGYRHRIIHEGAYIEEIIPSKNERNSLFQELDGYVGKIIEGMLDNAPSSWDQLQSFRVDSADQIQKQ